MKIIRGNIFTTNCQTIVNTVNCVGVMGAGIAYEFRLRYPDMYRRYVDLCNEKKLRIGSLWIYKGHDHWVLNFPTKNHWKYPSKRSYLEKGLRKFVNTYKEKGIESIAFPLLGVSNGGIPEDVSLEIMESFLIHVDIPVEIYQYDPSAYDDLFLEFKKLWTSYSDRDLAEQSGMRVDFVKKIRSALNKPEIQSMSRLLTVKGIGDVTLEKSFNFIMAMKENGISHNLFDQSSSDDDSSLA